jgi:hypothetical protein
MGERESAGATRGLQQSGTADQDAAPEISV